MRIQLRRGTAAQWAAGNPILAEGEPSWSTDTRVLKIGDGATAYSSLAAAGGGTGADPAAAALGLAAQTALPATCGSQFAVAAGNLSLVRVYLPAQSISSLGVWLFSGGVTANGNTNGVALYTEAGVLVDQTGSMTTEFQSSGFQSKALAGGAQTPAAGAYWLAVLTNFSGTNPNVVCANAIANIPSINAKRSSVFVAGQTAFPGSFNPATATLNSAAYYMAAF